MQQTAPVRRALVASATALAAAAVLQWLGLTAYRIPSSSMQPTLLGSATAGVHDRVLVDTLRYALLEPARWDLLAFHPPLQWREAWLKRCVGLPGERLAIAGGNVHRAERQGAGDRLVVLRRPAALQDAMWRELHPARAAARGQPEAAVFATEPAAAWRTIGATFRVALERGRLATLRWDDPDGGLVDRPWDGTPLQVARQLRARPENATLRGEIVPDARFAVRLGSPGRLVRARLRLSVVRPGQPIRHYSLTVAAGEVALAVHGAGAAALANSVAPFVPPDGALEIDFAHVDDELIARLDGREQLRMDVAAFDCRAGCALPDPCGAGPAMPTADQHAALQLELEGDGELAVDRLRIWRDQHWVGADDGSAAEPIAVPAGHYFVLGDNPHESTDSRGFDAVELHLRNGQVVAPATRGAVTLRGARLLVAADLPPRAGENPVCCVASGRLAFTDEFGNVHACRAPLAVDAATGLPQLPWASALTPVDDRGAERFVARQRILGRAWVRCWPVPPFGPWRPGWLR